MNTFRRILVPVDGSPTSNRALVAALQMARDGGGSVRLVHVLEPLAYLPGVDYANRAIADARRRAREVLVAAEAIAQSAGVPAETVLVDRPDLRLGEAVAEEARNWRADLVAVGSHGRRGIGRVLLGSGAEQIIRLAPSPVLVIRDGE